MNNPNDPSTVDLNSKVIARLHSSTSHLDFSDKLTVSADKKNREMYGGGKGNGFNSTIAVNITGPDFANPNNRGKNVNDYSRCNVSYNLSPEIFEIIQSIALENIGNRIAVGSYATGLYQPFQFSLNGNVLLSKMKNDLDFATVMQNTALVNVSPNDAKVYDMKTSREYSLSIQKVNTHVKDESGRKSLYSEFEIKRSYYLEYLNKATGIVENQERNRPYYWTITVSNSWVDTQESSKGLVSAKPGSATGKKSTSISATDEDMFAACWRVNHFIRCFEMAQCVPHYWNALQEESIARNDSQALPLVQMLRKLFKK